jgi:hypothetical protein
MAYSSVGNYPLTSCVQDNVTGLMWEGKEPASGSPTDYSSAIRAGNKRYTNHDNNTVGDSSWYVAQINSMNLCGYNDWRLPSVHELMTLVNYNTINPSINTSLFPNTAGYYYWSAQPDSANLAQGAWYVGFAEGTALGGYRYVSASVRLVRTAQ